jgi:hypothetical protein
LLLGSWLAIGWSTVSLRPCLLIVPTDSKRGDGLWHEFPH